MTLFICNESYENLSLLLKTADREGVVRIQGEDGKTYILQPEQTEPSPFDVPGVDLGVSTQEIVEIIREGRQGR